MDDVDRDLFTGEIAPAARAGLEIALAAQKFVKQCPSSAMRSNAGVCTASRP